MKDRPTSDLRALAGGRGLGSAAMATSALLQTRKNLQLLHDIAAKANEADNAPEALAYALERVCTDHGWAVGHAFLLRKYPTLRLQSSSSLWRCSEPAAFRAFRRLTQASSFEIGEGLVGTVARLRKPQWVENVARAEPPVRSSDGPLEPHSGLLVPVATRWESSAVAVLEFFSAERRRASNAKLRVAEDVGVLLGRVFEREHAEKQMAESRETEQRRIGRELHDTVSQELAGITMMAERLTEELEQADSPVASRAGKLVEHASRVRTKVHALSRGLLPVEIDSRGLPRALEYLAVNVRETHGLTCRVQCEDEIDVQDELVANHLVRIAQESIQNAVKHAQAETIEVTLAQRGPRLTLTVTDDGVGFSPRDNAGIGLRLMRHRASSIGAVLQVSSHPGRGTRVRCQLRG